MQHRVLIVVVGGLLVVGGAAALFLATRSAEKPVPPAAIAPAAAISTPVAPARPAARPSAPASGEPQPTAEAVPATGTLIIESDVPDTSVFVDRVFLGTAPATAAGLTPGPHRVNLSAAGYDGYAETIDVAAGTRTLTVRFKEVKLDASIAVVHRHAIGSCSGTLRATPQSLTYDTTNTGDAFRAPLTSLDTFTVDYLEKNLRVKVRNGKTYNFTDAEGKADRLYLFHQTVDKVRRRLLAGR
jgi:hypothetical protein